MKKLSIVLIGFFSLTFILLFGCEDLFNNIPIKGESSDVAKAEKEILSKYSPFVSHTTYMELQRVLIATEKYLDINKARTYGYADTKIIIPNMGDHYLKAEYLNDNKFDIEKPDFLVYNVNSNQDTVLVALEYAVPIDAMPDNPPEGFTGNDDVWDKNTTFGLWTCHAWVWKYNPDGVFNPTNPNVP
jgi:hypothetical protein